MVCRWGSSWMWVSFWFTVNIVHRQRNVHVIYLLYRPVHSVTGTSYVIRDSNQAHLCFPVMKTILALKGPLPNSCSLHINSHKMFITNITTDSRWVLPRPLPSCSGYLFQFGCRQVQRTGFSDDSSVSFHVSTVTNIAARVNQLFCNSPVHHQHCSYLSMICPL